MQINSLSNKFVYSKNKDSDKLMIVLHGLGDSSNGYKWLPKTLNLPELNYLFLDAPDQYYEGYSWYKIPEGKIKNRLSDLEIQSVKRSRDLLWETLEEIQEQGTSINDVFLFGFSQGCVMSLELCLRYPKVFAGICGISGYLFNPLAIEEDLSAKAKLQNILITHGQYDDLIPIKRVNQGVDFLRQLGLKVRFEKYPKAHTIDPYEELSLIREWIVKSI
ncbi:MAG: hypothetical protein QNJ31_01220 [Candidatus Caenarcaniphilales bacterium]|nr:hypothetical protein [Candidatus Caenarcaniphilales bacterium]